MILCDIGNTFFFFFQNGRVWKERADKILSQFQNQEIFYISVSRRGEEAFLKKFP